MEKENFLNILQQSEILTDVKESVLPALSARGLAFGFSGTTEVAGYEVHICIGASTHFPLREPIFFLLNHKDFEKIPHVEEDGYICYTNDDSLVLDIGNAEGIIRESFELVRQTIIKGFLKQNLNDFYNEYEAYWAKLKNQTIVYTNILVADEVKGVKYTRVREARHLFASSDEAERINSFHRLFNSKNSPPQFQNGLFIPLLPNAKVFIPEGNTSLTIDTIKHLISHHTSVDNKERINKALAKTKIDDLIIFSLPQPNGKFSLFGIRLKGINHRIHPLLNADTNTTITPLRVRHLDPEYMLARGGTGQTFLSKKVLVIGGGSVGSAVCEEIIKAGILSVDIIDKDTIEPENCYRHNCGYKYISLKKAEAIKTKLESYYPHCKVTAFSMSIEDGFNKRKINLQQYDAIIVATGNGTINQYLNEVFRAQIPGIPILFSWLDPYAIGGHCLLTNITDKGCYQCLYQNGSLHNTASFSAPTQPKSFSKSISGCSSMYIPYGSLDALQTAILTVRKLLDVFLKREEQNAIFSWKGNPDLFLSEGYNLSARFHQNDEQLNSAKYLFLQPNCRVCGNK
ncbi:hypothetical protein FC093_17460 [Ilyomonas limi]|uniref:Uncharacterized protein n=1 Tax=Ilyomonas limi TaxID=2575867 RepID=A0A4U3KZ14_9BACT|nr:ThiF family adenylyltransferase [Ilyomonas limi]TKK66367.1 hypothetical protein FC093_17460 [Ilyomonas limi]